MKKTNIQQSTRWQRLKEKLSHTFRFQVIEEETYDVVMILELSLGNIIMIMSTIIMSLLLLSFVLFSLTPIRYYTPGYQGGGTDKREIIELIQRTEDLEKSIDAKDKQLQNIKNLLTDRVKPEKISEAEKNSVEENNTTIVELQATPEEVQFRKQFEANINKNTGITEQIAWKSPTNAKAKVLKNINGTIFQYTLSNKDKTIATANGIVVNISINKGVTELILLHNDSFLSIYRCTANTKLHTGDDVNIGTPIFDIKNNNTTLQYELWHDGACVNILELI